MSRGGMNPGLSRCLQLRRWNALWYYRQTLWSLEAEANLSRSVLNDLEEAYGQLPPKPSIDIGLDLTIDPGWPYDAKDMVKPDGRKERRRP